jgi:hypothetical protein
MAVTQLNKLDIVSKRLDGRTHTSPVLATPSENISSTVQLGGQSIFADQLPTDSQIPTTAPTIYTRYSQSLGGKTVLEYVRFQLTAVGSGNYPYTAPGTDILISSSIEQIGDITVPSTNHTYALRLTGSYDSNSSNPKKANAPYTNNYHLTGSGFGLQIVPPAFGENYTPRLYSGSILIETTDQSDWVVDCSAGILWIQDPTQFAAGASTIPTHVDAYLYIGDYAAATIAALSASIQSVAGTNAYATMSVGGVAVIADTATGNLNIASGSFAGSANTNNNLLISGSAGTDTITFSFKDSPTFTSVTATNITASATPTVTDNTGYNIVLISSSGELVKIASLPSGSITGINSFATINVGGVTVQADSSADTLTINSGSFAGSANTNNNLLISASQDDVITFSFNDSPRFTNITASGNISSSAGLIGATLTISGGATVGGDLSVNGNTTLGNANTDTVTITAATVTAANLPTYTAGTHNSVLIQSASNIIAKRDIDSRVWGSTLISGSGTANQIAYFNAATGIVGDTGLTYNAATDVLTVNGSTFGQDVTIAGNLTVNGDTTIINTTNISIEDKFILLASGSGTTTDGGIIVQTTSGSSGVSTGSALFYNGTNVPADGSARWGLNNNVVHNATTVAPTDYLVSVSASTANPLNTAAGAPTYGSASAGFGNVHINTSNNTIWMYI